MNDKQENKYSMYLALVKVCDSFILSWSGVTAFADSYTVFKGHVVKLGGLLEQQLTAITGVRKDKLAALDTVVEQVLPVAGMLFAYATDMDDNTLRDSSKLSATDLRQVRDTVAGERARIIYTLAVPLEGALAAYGLVGGDLVALDASITAYENLVASPRVAIVTRKGATTEMRAEIRSADKVLKDRMDPLSLQFAVSAPEFYRNYKDARIIVDSGSGSVKKGSIALKVFDGMTMSPIEGATVNTLPETVEKLTDINGLAVLEGVAPGTYLVKVTKAGHVSGQVEVTVKSGEVVAADVKLMM
ncbi:MAG: carboxypeptidase-like regulatory domain-containing protein [Flavobacteriales bacterium]|nr:carboxypeptidase-like regulatory domain-containing protein [Flavobacteriales bacterium]